ncbi:MAG: DUF4270 family protein, partial [Bacteroidota bacterium]
MRHKYSLFILLAAVSAFFSCSDPALIGAELLEEDRANLQFTDEIPLQVRTTEGQPLQTFSPFLGLQLVRHPYGNYQDPLLGTTKASIYSQVTLGIQDAPESEIIRFDSVILSLAYDTLGNYGDLSEPFSMDVFLVEEEIISTEGYFSDQTFATNDTPIGSLEFVPNLEDRITITEYTNTSDSAVSANPHIRINLNDNFQNLFERDTLIFQSDSLLAEKVKGIYLVPSETTTNAGILSFNFNDRISKISFYYTRGRDELKQFDLDFNIGNPGRIVNFEQDFADSFAASFVESPQDSLVFIQGLKGFNAQISFPDLDDIRNIVVNK